MDNTPFDHLTKEMMADSSLKLSDPLFDMSVMRQISKEYSKQNCRRNLLLNFLLFAGIECLLLAVMWMLLLYSPKPDFFTYGIKSSLIFIQKAGNMVIDYSYLIISFIVVGLLDFILNKRVTFLQKEIRG